MNDFYNIINSYYWVIGFFMGVIVAFLPFSIGRVSTFILKLISN